MIRALEAARLTAQFGVVSRSPHEWTPISLPKWSSTHQSELLPDESTNHSRPGGMWVGNCCRTYCIHHDRLVGLKDWPIRLRQFGHDWSGFVVCTEILWLVTSWPVPTNLWTINPRILKHNVRHLRSRSAIGLEFNLDAAARNWSTKSRSIKNGKWQGLFYCKNWHPKIYLGDLT